MPKLLAAPLLYLTLSNYFAVYKLGFSIFPMVKGAFWNLCFLFSGMVQRNLKNNANTVIDQLYLMGDGLTVKMVKIDGV